MARKKKDVQRDLGQALNDMRSLIGNAEKVEELRSAQQRVDDLTTEMNQINIEESAERALAAASLDKEAEKAVRQFSFSKFIRELAEEKGAGLTGVEAEMAQLASNECRASGIALKGVGIPSVVLNRAFSGQTAGTNTEGGYTVESAMQYQEALRKKLVLAQAGANYVGGLVGNLDMIDGAAITASWGAENGDISDTKKAFSSRSLSPKRLGISVPISKQLILQSSLDVENIIITDMVNAHALALETAALNGSGSSNQPTGVLQTSGIGSVAMGTNGGAATFAKLVELETAIALADADLGAMSYITNSKVRGALKTTLKASGVAGYIWENGEVNGYKAFASNVIPSNLTKGTASETCSAVLFGNWNDLWICQWGGLDVIIDPYSLKKQGAIEIMLNAYHNIFVKRAASFAAIKDITTA